MSQAGGNIGTVQVVFTGNTDPFKRAAAEVKAESASVAKDVKVPTANPGVFKDFRQGVAGFSGALGALTAVAAAMGKLNDGIIEFKNAGGTLANTFRDIKSSLSFKIGVEADGLAAQMQDIEKQYADTLKKIEADEKEYYSGLAGIRNRIADELYGVPGFDLQRQQAAQALEGARRQYAELSKEAGLEAARIRDRDTRIRQGERLTEIQVESIELERSLGTEQEQLNKKIGERIRQIEELREERKDDPGFVAGLDRAEKRLREYLDRRNKAFEDAAKKDADALERAMSKAIESIRSKAASAFNPNQFESGLESIIQKMDIIVSQLGRGV